jgi:hypothetical protein
LGWEYHKENFRAPLKSVSYITYNDVYGGIYQSQVIDVVQHLKSNFELDIELIAFVPPRLWKSQKEIIKSHYPKARVYPILGALIKWKRSKRLLKILPKNKIAICRGPLAFGVAEGLFEKVIYDGRAAVKAEVEEYDVTGSKDLDKLFIEMEQKAVSNSNFKIAVSQKLIEYWNVDLGIKVSDADSVVIPCTLSSAGNDAVGVEDSNFVKVVYSGGTGAWQSFEKVVHLFRTALSAQPNLKVLFLTKSNASIEKLEMEFPDRVSRKWLNHQEVLPALVSCDYGILIRDKAVTNKVASPVKFAEYLNAGLKVLISPEIGDFSDFAAENNCGITVLDRIPRLDKVTEAEKKYIQQLCLDNFNKTSALIQSKYQKLIQQL